MAKIKEKDLLRLWKYIYKFKIKPSQSYENKEYFDKPRYKIHYRGRRDILISFLKLEQIKNDPLCGF